MDDQSVNQTIELPPKFRSPMKRVKDGQSNGVVAKELGVSDQTLRNWVNAFDAGKLTGSGIKVVTPEQIDMSRIRAENARLKMEVAILKKRRHTSRKMRCVQKRI